jgi:hypothetical protein
MSKNLSVPPKNRNEWRELVEGKIAHNFKNYVLQMKVHQMAKAVKSGDKTVEEAVEEVHALCEKYVLACYYDFEAIFKTW